MSMPDIRTFLGSYMWRTRRIPSTELQTPPPFTRRSAPQHAGSCSCHPHAGAGPTLLLTMSHIAANDVPHRC
eukprot:362269-Chlamydomonas_euryale.AAC.2